METQVKDVYVCGWGVCEGSVKSVIVYVCV